MQIGPSQLFVRLDIRFNEPAELERILAPNGFWLMYGFLKPMTELSQTGRFAPTGSRPERGLTEADIDRISARLHLLSRRDGQDTTRGRSSAWFLFQNTYET